MNAHELRVSRFLYSREHRARKHRQRINRCVAKIMFQSSSAKLEDVRVAVKRLAEAGFQILGTVKLFNFVEFS